MSLPPVTDAKGHTWVFVIEWYNVQDECLNIWECKGCKSIINIPTNQSPRITIKEYAKRSCDEMSISKMMEAQEK